MQFFKRIARDDRGANAIEYALLAALIGIGLIGSLNVTRSSLSAIFGMAASKMANSDAGSAASGGTTTAPVSTVDFALKTQTSAIKKTNSIGATEYDYTYSDGSTVVYTLSSVYQGDYYPENIVFKDAVTKNQYQYAPGQVDSTSGQNMTQAFTVSTYYNDGNIKSATRYTTFSADGTSMTGTVVNFNDVSNSGGTAGGSVTTPMSQAQPYIDQYMAYKNNAPSVN
jgi:pilus assembly protein Flp/PilA